MDGYDIFYEGRRVGTATMTKTAGGVRFDAVCTLSGDAVLRLYGMRDGKVLPVGVLAPHGGYWHIGRTISLQTLCSHGFEELLPNAFLLSERPPQAAVTGDPLIDAALENETVTLERRTDGFEVSCPFDPTAPSPLAFALTACTVINARAVLRLGREHRKSCTGSCRTLNEEKKEDCS